MSDPATDRDGLNLKLVGEEWVARGGEKEVYVHPLNPDELVKVVRRADNRTTAASRKLKHRLRRRYGVGPHKNLYRYWRNYLDAMLIAEQVGRLPPIADPRGLVLTDLGLGFVARRVTDGDGNLAPTLTNLVFSGAFDDAMLVRLNEFVDELYRFHIIATDLVPHNVVYETGGGRDRFVMIEGFGSRTIIPLRRWSRRVNDRSLDRAFVRFARRARLHWDPTRRRLHR